MMDNDNQAITLGTIKMVVPIVVPLVMVVGAWFALQTDLSHLESRVANDEVAVLRDIVDLEDRIHVMEIDTANRLSAIEATQKAILDHVMDIESEIMMLRSVRMEES